MPQVTSYSHIPNNTADAWWRDPCLRRNVLHCLGISLCVYYLGYDQNLLNGLQALPQWKTYFNNPASAQLGLATASIFLPAIVTAFLGDWVSARWGRKWGIRLGASLIVIGTFVNTFAHDFGMFIGSRWIIGAGGGITKVCAPALLHEIAHPRLRATLGATYYAFAYVGGVFAAWICFSGLYIESTWSWRFPTIFQLVGPVIVLALLFSIPESPRFLIHHGREDEALAVLAKHHANGQMDDELVLHEMREIKASLAAEAINKQTSYLDFLRTPANRRRLFVVIIISSGTNLLGNSLVSYYLSPILKLVGVTKPVEVSAINGSLAIWNLIVATVVAQYVEKIGRRPLWLISTIGMLVAFVIVTGLSGSFASTKAAATGLAVIPFLFIFFGFYDIAWTIQCYSYTTEILPYDLRTKGLAIFVCVQNLVLAFNTYVNPIALAAIAWKYYIVYLATQVVMIVIIYFYFPEIKGLTIDEISLVFDKGIVRSAERMGVAHQLNEKNVDVREEPEMKDSAQGVFQSTSRVYFS